MSMMFRNNQWFSNPKILLAALVACAAQSYPVLAQTFWSGTTAGGTLTWTADNVTIARNNSIIYSERDNALRQWKEEFKEFASASNETPPDSIWCQYERGVAALSFVGSYLSLRRNNFTTCIYLAHPMMQTDYVTINTARPGQPVSLTELFPEPQLLKALLADKLVKDALAERGIRRKPQKLSQLMASLAEWNGKCEYYFPDDFLSRFAFHHLEGKKVAVRIGLPHGCEAARGNLTELGILLPIPSALRGALGLASTGKEGFLMKNKPKGNLTTTISANHALTAR